MGFCDADDCKAGDEVVYGGAWRRVAAVLREGRCSPYFQLEGSDEWVSWQNCGGYQKAATSDPHWGLIPRK